MFKIFCKCLCVIIALHTTNAFAKELTVAVASNVQYAFQELKQVFEKDTGIHLKAVVGSSGKFVSLIEHGAPFDVLLSADMDFPLRLASRGLAYNSPQVYAYGTLVLWTIGDVDLSLGVHVLAQSQTKKIAIANPQTAPYGRQAVKALKNKNLYALVEKKLVYGESIAQVNQFIMTQAVDYGITSKSSVVAPPTIMKGRWVELDKNTYEPMMQGIVILKHAQKGNVEDAQQFFDFILSQPARDILKKYGYELPRGT